MKVAPDPLIEWKKQIEREILKRVFTGDCTKLNATTVKLKVGTFDKVHDSFKEWSLTMLWAMSIKIIMHRIFFDIFEVFSIYMS